MNSEIIKILIELLPSLLWFGLALAILIIFYKPIRNDLLPNLSGLKAMGVELAFITTSINEALELAEKNKKWLVKVPPEAKENVLNRAKKHLKIFKDAQIFWIDDCPENNINEWRMFFQLKTKIEIAKSTKEAMKKLGKKKYDLIISDMAREEIIEEQEKKQKNEVQDEKAEKGKKVLVSDAGKKFLDEFREKGETTPVIFYIGTYDPEKGLPKRSFGITNRPDELLHLVMDALSRKKY
jgi:CheY-like chemotaxis protein